MKFWILDIKLAECLLHVHPVQFLILDRNGRKPSTLEPG